MRNEGVEQLCACARVCCACLCMVCARVRARACACACKVDARTVLSARTALSAQNNGSFDGAWAIAGISEILVIVGFAGFAIGMCRANVADPRRGGGVKFPVHTQDSSIVGPAAVRVVVGGQRVGSGQLLWMAMRARAYTAACADMCLITRTVAMRAHTQGRAACRKWRGR